MILFPCISNHEEKSSLNRQAGRYERLRSLFVSALPFISIGQTMFLLPIAEVFVRRCDRI